VQATLVQSVLAPHSAAVVHCTLDEVELLDVLDVLLDVVVVPPAPAVPPLPVVEVSEPLVLRKQPPGAAATAAKSVATAAAPSAERA
jgi:hypothetical protein